MRGRSLKTFSFKHFARGQLEARHPEAEGLSITNWAIVFLILASLVLYTAETEEEIQTGAAGTFGFLDNAILWIFGFEFLMRLFASGPNDGRTRWRDVLGYVRRNKFIVLVDLVAFAPELIFILLGWGAPSWLRSLRVFRLFKMTRYFPAVALVVDALRSCAQELLVAVALSTVVWYLAAVVMYLAESAAQPDSFGSITRAMWWSVTTLTTVGYGDTYPVTVFGKIAAGLFAVVGVGSVALPSGIIAAAFIQRFRERGIRSRGA
jgi:voltage-gated potassium channel